MVLVPNEVAVGVADHFDRRPHEPRELEQRDAGIKGEACVRVANCIRSQLTIKTGPLERWPPLAQARAIKTTAVTS